MNRSDKTTPTLPATGQAPSLDGPTFPAPPPETAEQRQARAEAIRNLGAVVGPEDTVELWDSIYRGIDEGRPHRPLFKGEY